MESSLLPPIECRDTQQTQLKQLSCLLKLFRYRFMVALIDHVIEAV